MTDTDKNLPDGVERDPITTDEDDQARRPAWEDDNGLELPRNRSETEEDPDALGDRTISPVGSRLASSKGVKLAGVALMCLVGGVALAMTWKGDERPKAGEMEDGPARQTVQFEAADGPPPAPPVLDENAEAEAMLLGDQPADPASAEAGEPEVDPRVQKLYDAQRAPIMVQSGGGGSGGGAGNGSGGQGQTGGSQGDGQQQGLTSSLLGGPARQANEMEQLRQGSSIGRSRARMLPNRNYLVTAGTQIPCVLQTAMHTSTPGYVSCMLSRDVYSDNGNVVLMERGTRVLGEYRGGLRRGQNRMFVVWNRAVTPKGVSINLGSPATDTLGRAGMSGEVETFFWERFGGALLLSVVDDAVALAGNYDAARNTVRQPSDAASVSLENSINIAPVLRKNQGEEVSIFAASDFDFSSVYGLTLR